MIDLSAIRKRSAQATPGPWEAWLDEVFRDGIYRDLKEHKTGGYTYKREVCTFDDFHDDDDDGGGMEQKEADAEFICRARSDVPALCDEVEALRKRLDAAKELLHEFDRNCEDGVCEKCSGRLKFLEGEAGE